MIDEIKNRIARITPENGFLFPVSLNPDQIRGIGVSEPAPGVFELTINADGWALRKIHSYLEKVLPDNAEIDFGEGTEFPVTVTIPVERNEVDDAPSETN